MSQNCVMGKTVTVIIVGKSTICLSRHQANSYFMIWQQCDKIISFFILARLLGTCMFHSHWTKSLDFDLYNCTLEKMELYHIPEINPYLGRLE